MARRWPIWKRSKIPSVYIVFLGLDIISAVGDGIEEFDGQIDALYSLALSFLSLLLLSLSMLLLNRLSCSWRWLWTQFSEDRDKLLVTVFFDEDDTSTDEDGADKLNDWIFANKSVVLVSRQYPILRNLPSLFAIAKNSSCFLSSSSFAKPCTTKSMPYFDINSSVTTSGHGHITWLT